MLMLPSGIKIFLRCEPTDMRMGYEGLSALAMAVFSQEPLSGHLFVFLNKARNRVKILFWDGGGFCLFCKRLERGTFALPNRKELFSLSYEVDRVGLAMLLDGITAKEITRKKRYIPVA
jgi:transposase